MVAVHYMPGWTRYEKEPGKNHLVEHHITVKPGEVLPPNLELFHERGDLGLVVVNAKLVGV